MAYSFIALNKHIRETEAWLRAEYAGIRTGQATPALLDGITVEAYGGLHVLAHVASVSVENPRTLRVSAFDADNLKNIERAIADAGLGVSTALDERGVRVHFPELTGERRKELVKLILARLEEARIALRHERDRVWQDIQKREKDGEMSEDEKFRAKEEMEAIIKQGNEQLAAVARTKEAELMK